jgi:hypothetical protein
MALLPETVCGDGVLGSVRGPVQARLGVSCDGPSAFGPGGRADVERSGEVDSAHRWDHDSWLRLMPLTGPCL